MIDPSLVRILCMVRMHVHLHLRLPGCGHVSSTTEYFSDLSLAIPGWVSAPAAFPTVQHATATVARLRSEAQGRRCQELLASLPAGLKEPPAHLKLASCLQACSCCVCNACALRVHRTCEVRAGDGCSAACSAPRSHVAHRVAMQCTTHDATIHCTGLRRTRGAARRDCLRV